MDANRSRLLDAVIRLSQYTPFGVARESFTALRATPSTNQKAEADYEAAHLDDFLRFFPDATFSGTVLDFGCGYGGKAVELASRHPAHVIGVELGEKKMGRALDYAKRRGVNNFEFRPAPKDSIPLDSRSVDIVVSHDVMEHVYSPEATIRELARVMKAGGVAYIVFPPYAGAFSHHLDFITRFPALHWLWKPDTIMQTVNAILTTDYGKRFHTPPQPLPEVSPLTGDRVLPSLNGLSTAAFLKLAAPHFTVTRLERVTLMDKLTKIHVPRAMATAMKHIALRCLPADHLTLTLAVTLTARQDC